jgi:hypothetical protein
MKRVDYLVERSGDKRVILDFVSKRMGLVVVDGMYLAEGETRSGLFWNLWFHKIWGVCYLAAGFLRRTLLRVVLNLKPSSARNCYLILLQCNSCIKPNKGVL